ncbi:MAG: hypothetical protein JRL30_29330, partial [Deltaproteobacteria bacterium]|nr:hypothetical protein [Deltaproteobacteria bacterium]
MYQLDGSVQKAVHFIKGNVLDPRFLMDQSPYDIIFCRNLLIYLSQRAKKQTFESINRLLAGSGILFVGHAERQAAMEWGFAGIPEFGVFACRKERRKRERSLKPKSDNQPRPRQRLFEKVGEVLQPTTRITITPAHSLGKVSESTVPNQLPELRGSLSDPKDLSGVTTCHSGNAILSQKATCISWTALFKKQSTSSK